MKKQIIILLMFVGMSNIQAQERLITRTGTIEFVSITPLENIEAKSNQVASIFDVSKNIIAFNVLLKSFKFEKALMEEHFNEKYVHSDTYPSAKFKGTVDLEIDRKTPKRYKNVTISGTMHMHGVSEPIIVQVDIEVLKDKTIQLECDFKMKLSTYNIEVPSIVKEKIASDIAIHLIANYK